MKFDIQSMAIPEVKLITPRRFGDSRGFFSETHSELALSEAGISIRFVQDNHSFSEAPFVLRGLHFQVPPLSQTKLVRVTRGRIFDVAVDLRKGSPTYGRWVGAEVSADNWRQILVPRGFAHGLLTLEPRTEVLYKVDGYYDAEADAGVIWNDPEIGVDWPLEGFPQLSAKDATLPRLADFPSPFLHEG